MSDTKNRRVGRVVAKHRTNDEKFGIGGIFSPFPGAYSLGFALKNEDGTYDQVTAIKTQSGKKLDISNFYLNMYINEELVPYDKD